MIPRDFINRLRLAYPPIPDGVEVDEIFVMEKYGPDRVEQLKLPKGDADILMISGLPNSVAPFLSFGSHKNLRLVNALDLPTALVPRDGRFYSIGTNGSGDVICIDSESGNVVSFNHDNLLKKVFINSSVTQLAICLCMITESITSGHLTDFLGELRNVDIKACELGAMWPTEYRILKNQ